MARNTSTTQLCQHLEQLNAKPHLLALFHVLREFTEEQGYFLSTEQIVLLLRDYHQLFKDYLRHNRPTFDDEFSDALGFLLSSDLGFIEIDGSEFNIPLRGFSFKTIYGSAKTGNQLHTKDALVQRVVESSLTAQNEDPSICCEEQQEHGPESDNGAISSEPLCREAGNQMPTEKEIHQTTLIESVENTILTMTPSEPPRGFCLHAHLPVWASLWNFRSVLNSGKLVSFDLINVLC